LLSVNTVVAASQSVVASPARQPWLDTLRGVAVVWMTVYHFSFDLNHFGWIHQDFYRAPVWTLQRTCILSLFLLCAGLGQAIAFNHKQPWPQFWRRWTQIAVCALLVSAGSWFVFPHSWIYFGVLHGMAVMILVCRLTAGWGRWLWLAGAITLAVWWSAPTLHASWPPMAVFDVKALSWLGLASVKPVTEDYVPLFPWMAVMWWGMGLGQWARARSIFMRAFAGQRNASPLNWLGRWSLTWYMLHQPVIMGALMLLSTLR
jgi:uncharacterized membrane protein